MATLYVRNFPEELHERIRQLAAERHRSLGAEVIVLVDQALRSEEDRARHLQALEEIGRRREKIKMPPGAQNSLTMLREDRDR